MIIYNYKIFYLLFLCFILNVNCVFSQSLNQIDSLDDYIKIEAGKSYNINYPSFSKYLEVNFDLIKKQNKINISELSNWKFIDLTKEIKADQIFTDKDGNLIIINYYNNGKTTIGKYKISFDNFTEKYQINQIWKRFIGANNVDLTDNSTNDNIKINISTNRVNDGPLHISNSKWYTPDFQRYIITSFIYDDDNNCYFTICDCESYYQKTASTSYNSSTNTIYYTDPDIKTDNDKDYLYVDNKIYEVSENSFILKIDNKGNVIHLNSKIKSKTNTNNIRKTYITDSKIYNNKFYITGTSEDGYDFISTFTLNGDLLNSNYIENVIPDETIHYFGGDNLISRSINDLDKKFIKPIFYPRLQVSNNNISIIGYISDYLILDNNPIVNNLKEGGLLTSSIMYEMKYDKNYSKNYSNKGYVNKYEVFFNNKGIYDHTYYEVVRNVDFTPGYLNFVLINNDVKSYDGISCSLKTNNTKFKTKEFFVDPYPYEKYIDHNPGFTMNINDKNENHKTFEKQFTNYDFLINKDFYYDKYLDAFYSSFISERNVYENTGGIYNPNRFENITKIGYEFFLIKNIVTPSPNESYSFITEDGLSILDNDLTLSNDLDYKSKWQFEEFKELKRLGIELNFDKSTNSFGFIMHNSKNFRNLESKRFILIKNNLLNDIKKLQERDINYLENKLKRLKENDPLYVYNNGLTPYFLDSFN